MPQSGTVRSLPTGDRHLVQPNPARNLFLHMLTPGTNVAFGGAELGNALYLCFRDLGSTQLEIGEIRMQLNPNGNSVQVVRYAHNPETGGPGRLIDVLFTASGASGIKTFTGRWRFSGQYWWGCLPSGTAYITVTSAVRGTTDLFAVNQYDFGGSTASATGRQYAVTTLPRDLTNVTPADSLMIDFGYIPRVLAKSL
jgi:hypothetical protein